jgi:hypothetical protein
MVAQAGPLSSQGTTIKKGTGTAIAFLTKIDGLDIKLNTIETTDLSASFKTFVGGLKEVSDIQISGFFDYTSHSTVLTDLLATNQAAASYTIQFPAGAGATGVSWTFNAIVTGFKTSAGVGNIITFDATLKVSGAPTLVAGS